MTTKIFRRDALRGLVVASAALLAVSSLPAARSVSASPNRGSEFPPMSLKTDAPILKAAYHQATGQLTYAIHTYE